MIDKGPTKGLGLGMVLKIEPVNEPDWHLIPNFWPIVDWFWLVMGGFTRLDQWLVRFLKNVGFRFLLLNNELLNLY